MENLEGDGMRDLHDEIIDLKAEYMLAFHQYLLA